MILFRLRCSVTYSLLQCSTTSSVTIFSANSLSVQRLCPSGGRLHARAIRCASASPSSSHWAERSIFGCCNAAPSPCVTSCLRTRSTVAPPHPTAFATSLLKSRALLQIFANLRANVPAFCWLPAFLRRGHVIIECGAKSLNPVLTESYENYPHEPHSSAVLLCTVAKVLFGVFTTNNILFCDNIAQRVRNDAFAALIDGREPPYQERTHSDKLWALRSKHNAHLILPLI